jgi:Zn-finger nucleic acid-binding protein
MKNILFIFIFITLRANAFTFINETFAYTLQIQGKESKINVVADAKKIEITFDYAPKNRNVIIQVENLSELLNQLKAKKPQEYSLKDMENLYAWLEKQLKTKESKRTRFSTLKTENLKGNIKQIEITRYSIDPVKKELTQDTCCAIRSEYNQDGNITENNSFNIKNIAKNGRLFEYHPNGLLKQIMYINEKKQVTYREVFELDENGNYVGGLAYEENDKLHRTFKILGQNEYGQWTRFNWYSLDGSIYEEQEIIYQDNLKVYEVWKKNNEIVMDFRTTYDAKGEKLSEEGKHPFLGTVNNRINSRIDAYDEKGNWTQKTFFTKEGNISKVIKRKILYY